ncbi:MAG: hypothetical protein Q8K60_06625 [Parachlamydiaceae bacterium]|nr:hypothetical protein [Parachlamydiaceae bacterium]
MNQLKFKKRFITLVEMMIVMFLIAMITGVIAYNYTGSLEEGKAFKTKTGIEKIHTVLDLHLATHPEDRATIDTRWKDVLKQSQLVKNASDLEKDGWGNDYSVSINNETGEIDIQSQKYKDYQAAKQGTMFKSNREQR